jgi:hypothetical protein
LLQCDGGGRDHLSDDEEESKYERDEEMFERMIPLSSLIVAFKTMEVDLCDLLDGFEEANLVDGTFPDFDTSCKAPTVDDEIRSTKIVPLTSESVHEKRASDISASDALQRLTSSNKGNPDYVNFNLGFQRGPPPVASGSTSSRFSTVPNPITELMKSGLFILPGLGLITRSSKQLEDGREGQVRSDHHDQC